MFPDRNRMKQSRQESSSGEGKLPAEDAANDSDVLSLLGQFSTSSFQDFRNSRKVMSASPRNRNRNPEEKKRKEFFKKSPEAQKAWQSLLELPDPDSSLHLIYTPPLYKYRPPSFYQPEAGSVPENHYNAHEQEPSSIYLPPTQRYAPPAPSLDQSEPLPEVYKAPEAQYYPPAPSPEAIQQLAVTYEPPTKPYSPPSTFMHPLDQYEPLPEVYKAPEAQYYPPAPSPEAIQQLAVEYEPPEKPYSPPSTLMHPLDQYEPLPEVYKAPEAQYYPPTPRPEAFPFQDTIYYQQLSKSSRKAEDSGGRSHEGNLRRGLDRLRALIAVSELPESHPESHPESQGESEETPEIPYWPWRPPGDPIIRGLHPISAPPPRILTRESGRSDGLRPVNPNVC